MGQNPWFPRFEIKKLTAIAIGSGIGAALGYGLLPWYVGIPVLLFVLLIPSRVRARYIAALAICIVSGVTHKYFDDQQMAQIPRHACCWDGIVTVADKRLTIHEVLPQPRVINAEISASGKSFAAAVIFPADFGRVFYGDRFKVSGSLIPAAPGGVDFDGCKFAGLLPPLYGGRPLLIIRNVEKVPETFNMFRIFFRLREVLLERMLKYIDDPEAGAMAARMFFSASTGASRQLNRNFVITGTVHLFSVSGIHVSILAGIILLLLRFVPFEWRYRITAFIIPVYVMCTGASIPAIRAGTMIVIWCLMRSMLYYAPGWNAMMLCWSAFAFLAPETVGDLGAQYSFGITAALILLMDKLRILKQKDQEILELMPPRDALTGRKRKIFRRTHQIRGVLAVPLVAFVAGSGLSLLRQNLFVPGSILTNFLLPFLTPLLFPGLIFKLTAGMLHPAIDRCGAWILEKSFQLLSCTVSFMAEIFVPFAAIDPPGWSVALFYILLFTALSHRNHKLCFWCVAGILLLLGAAPLLKSDAPGHISVISRGAGTPALLAYIPAGSRTAWIVDVPDNVSANIAGRNLAKSGVLYCNVGFSAGTGTNSYGLEMLTRQLSCIVYPPETRRSKAFTRNITRSNAVIDPVNKLFQISASGRGVLQWQTADGVQIFAKSTAEGRHISVKLPSGRNIEALLPWCSIPVVWQLEIPR